MSDSLCKASLVLCLTSFLACQSPDSSYASAFRPVSFLQHAAIVSKRTLATQLNASPNVDPYARLVENYQKRGKSINVDSTTPAPESEPAKIVEDVQSSISDAVSSASDASSTLLDSTPSLPTDEVTGAAAAAAPTAKSIVTNIFPGLKAKSFAGAGASGVKAPTLVEFITRGAPVSSEGVDTLANAKEKLEIMKQNLLHSVEYLRALDVESVKNVKVLVPGADTLTENAGGLIKGLTEASSGTGNFLTSLNLETYGPWYVAVAALIVGLAQRGAGKEEVRAKMEQELAAAQQKANQAAEAAALAAAGAQKVKELVTTGKSARDSRSMLEEARMEQLKVEKVREKTGIF